MVVVGEVGGCEGEARRDGVVEGPEGPDVSLEDKCGEARPGQCCGRARLDNQVPGLATMVVPQLVSDLEGTCHHHQGAPTPFRQEGSRSVSPAMPGSVAVLRVVLCLVNTVSTD